MFSIVKKELCIFFASFSAYIFMAVFLLLCSVFLWIIPQNVNVFDNLYANLDGFFNLAPWVFLFLIPALCMRLFADEKRTGTLELLLTRPLTYTQIVAGKFLSAFIITIFALLPTLLYFYTIYQLSQPVGNVDTGAFTGSYIGLVLLAGGYIAISLFCSSLTSQQIMAFVLSIVLCFIFYLGFEYVSGLHIFAAIQNQLLALSINEHYLSLSRGVVDTRDLVYFLSLIIAFLFITIFTLKMQRS